VGALTQVNFVPLRPTHPAPVFRQGPSPFAGRWQAAAAGQAVANLSRSTLPTSARVNPTAVGQRSDQRSGRKACRRTPDRWPVCGDGFGPRWPHWPANGLL